MRAEEICNAGRRRKTGMLFGAISVTMLGLVAQGRPATARVSPPFDTPEICRAAAKKAALRTGVPYAVLLAITLAETGRMKKKEFLPWPWTINMEGAGHWFQSRAKALAFAKRNFDRGARSFDLGCFQINYKWHGSGFASMEDMLDPEKGALYAAQYLASLFREKGNWTLAAGAYHSRTPVFAKKYSDRFERILASLGSVHMLSGRQPAGSTHSDNKGKPNSYPLLAGGKEGPRTSGSITVLTHFATRARLFVASKRRLF
ncbi:MAG: transglycosylase SLT domain-containing protein [Paracoccaceae bacterium]